MPKPIRDKSDKPRGGGKPRDFDTTCLHEKTHGYVVHRDYAAHFFRWGFARRLIRAGSRVLEVGCGVDTPLVKTFMFRNGDQPSLYLGVDLNTLPKRPNAKWAGWLQEFNFVKDHRLVLKWHGRFDYVVCLEVIEHMSAPDGVNLLGSLLACCEPGGTLLLSTPMFSPSAGAANNHIHEWTGPELAKALDETGWVVERRYGTFINVNDVRRVMSPAEREVYDRLREYYDDDVMACFLAPLHPEQSRNNLWVCHPK